LDKTLYYARAISSITMFLTSKYVPASFVPNIYYLSDETKPNILDFLNKWNVIRVVCTVNINKLVYRMINSLIGWNIWYPYPPNSCN